MNASFGAQHPLLHRISALIFRPEIGKAMLVLVGLLPAMALLADIHRFAVNVPFMDDWQFVPLLERAMNGTLTFKELWAPHDEHRLLLPRTDHHRLNVCHPRRLSRSMLHHFCGCGDPFGLSALADGASQRIQIQRPMHLGAGEHRPVLPDPVPQLALADAICLLPSLYFPSRFAFARFMLEFLPSRNSCWQPSSRWLATSVSCKAT